MDSNNNVLKRLWCVMWYMCIAPEKVFFSTQKYWFFFLFLHENIMLSYSLEAPQGSASNEYHNICFHGEIRKMICVYPVLWFHIGCPCVHLSVCPLYVHPSIFSYKDDNLSNWWPRWLIWMRRPTGDQKVVGSTPAEVGNILSWR